MSLVKVDAYVKDLRYVSESNHIAIPAIELTFIQVCGTTRGAKKEVERPKEVSSNLRGSTAQEDSIIDKKSVIDWLDSDFKR